MTPDERNLINGLFDRLRQADANAPAKDREAEDFIRQLTTQVPSAAYLLTQTTLVQEHALTNAQARIADLEKQLTQARQQQPASSGSSGGFLSGLFGGHSSTPRRLRSHSNKRLRQCRCSRRRRPIPPR